MMCCAVVLWCCGAVSAVSAVVLCCRWWTNVSLGLLGVCLHVVHTILYLMVGITVNGQKRKTVAAAGGCCVVLGSKFLVLCAAVHCVRVE